jgi:uncharacterized membrane protein
MTTKKYGVFRIAMVIFLSLALSQAMIYKNFYLSIGLVVIASLILYLMRKRVEGIMFDERDLRIGGEAALQSLSIYAWISVCAMFILKSSSIAIYDAMGNLIAFSTCILMLIYSLVYRLKAKKGLKDARLIYVAIVLIFFVILGIIGMMGIK